MRNTAVLACAVLLAAAAGGCSKQISGLKEAAEGGFQKPLNLFSTPEWARTSNAHVDLGPRGPVPPEDMVSADGQCAPAPAETTSAAAPAPAPAAAQHAATPASGGTGFAGGLQTGGGAGPAAAPVAVGGIALGMTECQAVRRAGTPTNVSIGAGEGGDRRVVLTYLSGPWPGIYTFSSGRLKVIDAAPVPEKKPAPKKKKHAKSASSAGRTYVQ
jgi:hypothetical protein